jgi:exopolysaccharide biosynthesis protein
LTGSLYNRPVFAIKNGSPVIEHITTRGIVRVDQVEHELYGFNQPLINTEEASIYTYKYGKYSPVTTTYFYHIQVKDNKVVGMSDKSSVIPMGGFVLVINKKFITKDINEISYNIDTSIPNLSQAVAGGPTLVKQGRICIERQDFKGDILDSKRSRTAIGFTKAGTVLLVTVRGNITIRQLSVIMYELGCAEAMNLDGGGSAQMIYKNKSIVKSKRWISTAILTD